MGHHGLRRGRIPLPKAVAVDTLGNVFVADTFNDRIQVFDSAGNFVRMWGSRGSAVGQFVEPNGVAVDASGNVFVAERANHRVQVFDSAGNFIRAWGGLGSGLGQFRYPESVAVDALGNVFVTDSGNGRVQVFDALGNFVEQWTVGLGGPRGVAVDSSGNVVVVRVNGPTGVVRVFAPPRPPISLDSVPSIWSNDTSPSFGFSTADPQAQLRCRISTEATRSDCTSPKTFPGLADGAYWFRVLAVSRFGVESDVIRWDWNVDTIAPDVHIDSGPSGTVSTHSASFTFSSTDPTARFRCRLDAAAWQDCSSPKSYASLAAGAHTFRVTALDRAGNSSAIATRTWTVS